MYRHDMVRWLKTDVLRSRVVIVTFIFKYEATGKTVCVEAMDHVYFVFISLFENMHIVSGREREGSQVCV